MALLAAGCSDKSANQPEVDTSAPAEPAVQEQQPSTAAHAPMGDAAGRVLDTTTQPMVRMGAQLNAAASVCGDASQAETDAAATQSRQAMVERGYSAADHDRIYGAEFKVTEGKFGQMSAAEKARSCDELKQWGKAAEEAAKAMQQ
jgi:hypothetical protein